MPTIDTVRAKFKEFREDLNETRLFMAEQRAPIAQNHTQTLSAYNTAMDSVHNSLGPVALKRLQRILSMSSINIDLPRITKTAREKSEENAGLLAKSIEQHGSDEYLSQQISSTQNTIHRIKRECTRAMLELVGYQQKFRPLLTYNKFAEENNKPLANSSNIDDFAHSLLWEVFNNLNKLEEVELSRLIRSFPKRERQQKFAEYERVYDAYFEATSNEEAAEKAYEELCKVKKNRGKLNDDILTEQELKTKINESLILPLMKNAGFREKFSSEYAEQAQEVLLHHARYVARQQILSAIDFQISSLDEGINKIEKTLKKLERARGYKNIDINLDSVETAIAEGLAKAEIFARDMDTRSQRSQSYSPPSNQDSSQYYNQMILYMYMAGLPPFDHNNTADQSAALNIGEDFAATMPDVAHLDMALFNPLQDGLSNFSIPDLGHEISAAIESNAFQNSVYSTDTTASYTDSSPSISFDSSGY